VAIGRKPCNPESEGKSMAGWTRLGVLALCALVGTPAFACEVATDFVAFAPNVKGVEVSPPWMPVPRPEVRVASVRHPVSNIPGKCDSYTWAVIEVSVPPGSAFSARDLGFVFRSPNPQDPYLSVPNYPITSTAMSDDGTALRFTFGFEGRGKTVPIEVFAINKAFQVGPSATVAVALLPR
jgi:hypothetical protein